MTQVQDKQKQIISIFIEKFFCCFFVGGRVVGSFKSRKQCSTKYILASIEIFFFIPSFYLQATFKQK